MQGVIFFDLDDNLIRIVKIKISYPQQESYPQEKNNINKKKR